MHFFMHLKTYVKSSPVLLSLSTPAWRLYQTVMSHVPMRGTIPEIAARTHLAPLRMKSHEAYAAWATDNAGELARRKAVERKLYPAEPAAFDFDGVCALCQRPARFVSTFAYTIPDEEDGREIPYLRELV